MFDKQILARLCKDNEITERNFNKEPLLGFFQSTQEVDYSQFS